jgi:hypothetical protein
MLGALIVAGAMANVVMMNMSYDVCVKLGSMHILLLALVLLAPDLRRLVDFFILNRATQPASLGPYLPNKGLGFCAVGVKVVLVGSLLAYFSWDTWRAYQRQAAMREKPPTPPEGWYQITSVKRDGNRVSALPVEDGRWRTFLLRGNYVSLRCVDGTVGRFVVEGDPLTGPAVIYPADEKRQPINGAPSPGSLSLKVTEDREAQLRVMLNAHAFEATLRRENPDDFPLMSRGFRWVSEAPYFR